jgi:pentatricopeptide repeat protein
VIIDFHAHKKCLEEAKGFFAEMANKYGEHPNVIYEISFSGQRRYTLISMCGVLPAV